LLDLRRCLAANVITATFKFGDRLAFESFQRFLARRHDPKLGHSCSVASGGHHKRPEYIAPCCALHINAACPFFILAMREIREQDNHTTGEALGGKRPVADR
jgi:hypothetical protein